jgi:hypothetical protein
MTEVMVERSVLVVVGTASKDVCWPRCYAVGF